MKIHVFTAACAICMYSADQMQSIRQTRFDRILNVFGDADERVYH